MYVKYKLKENITTDINCRIVWYLRIILKGSLVQFDVSISHCRTWNHKSYCKSHIDW